MRLTVPIQRLDGYAGPLPAYQTDLAAGMDVHAWVPEGTMTLSAGAIAMVATGFALAVPEGFEAQIRPRSGLASRSGITLPNSPGTIDADYRGPVKVPLINHGQNDFTVENGMRIAQMLILPVPIVIWEQVPTLPATNRGDGGFGHTGT